jgi:hypothetical protein
MLWVLTHIKNLGGSKLIAGKKKAGMRRLFVCGN